MHVFMYPTHRNVTGTLLATSGDDPSIFVWKKDFAGEWVITAQLRGIFLAEDEVL